MSHILGLDHFIELEAAVKMLTTMKHSPLTPLSRKQEPRLKMIRRHAMMDHIAKRHITSNRHEGLCMKYIVKLLAVEKKIADDYRISLGTHGKL